MHFLRLKKDAKWRKKYEGLYVAIDRNGDVKFQSKTPLDLDDQIIVYSREIGIPNLQYFITSADGTTSFKNENLF